MALLEVRNLSVRYGTNCILNDLSFSVEPGQWLMVVGPNGAGKSTLIGAVAQNIPYTGTVSFRGEDLKHCPPKRLAQHLGVLTQNHYVGYGFTVEEVIRLGRYAHAPRLLSGKKDDSEEKLREAIEKTGMGPYLGQSVLKLSGGELQRTFLAQLFAQDPELLMLDEPTNHLDLVYQRQVFHLVRDWIAETGRSVVSVVHVNSEVRDNARPSFTPELKRLYAKASGGREVPPEVQNRQAPHFRQIKGFPVSRIVPEDDPLLSFFRWYWYDGDRWNSYSTDATRIYQDRQYPMATMYDPIVRNPPIRGSGGKVTFGSQWVYVVPEPYNCSFSVSEEQAMVRGHPGQGVWAMIQAITYRRECAPGAPPEARCAGGTYPPWRRSR